MTCPRSSREVMATQEEHPAILLLPRQRPAPQENVLHRSFACKMTHGHTSHVPIPVMSLWTEAVDAPWWDLHATTGSGCCSLLSGGVWCRRTLSQSRRVSPMPFPGWCRRSQSR